MNLASVARQFLARRRYVYNATFRAPIAAEVLADLAKFCRANESTFHADPRVHAVAEGRREVFLRIQKHIRLTDEELFSLYGTGQPTIARTTED